MKIILQDNRRYILSFQKGEEVFEGLRNFMAEQNIFACGFTAIGACAFVELGFYNEFLKEYRLKKFAENLEITSLIGNGGIKDSKPILHAHGTFSRLDFTMLGGHVTQMSVSAVCEIFLIKLEGAMERKLDEDTNLNLLC